MLAAWIVLVAGLLYVVATGYTDNAPVVRYGSQVIAPVDDVLCPGEQLTFEQRFEVDAAEVPSVLTIHEAWFSEQRGVVLISTVTVYNVPLVRPYDLTATVSRTVPDLAPGVYWFDHTATNGHTTGYTVGPVVVGVCG